MAYSTETILEHLNNRGGRLSGSADKLHWSLAMANITSASSTELMSEWNSCLMAAVGGYHRIWNDELTGEIGQWTTWRHVTSRDVPSEFDDDRLISVEIDLLTKNWSLKASLHRVLSCFYTAATSCLCPVCLCCYCWCLSAIVKACSVECDDHGCVGSLSSDCVRCRHKQLQLTRYVTWRDVT